LPLLFYASHSEFISEYVETWESKGDWVIFSLTEKFVQLVIPTILLIAYSGWSEAAVAETSSAGLA